MNLVKIIQRVLMMIYTVLVSKYELISKRKTLYIISYTVKYSYTIKYKLCL